MSDLFTLTQTQAWTVIGILFVLVAVQYTFAAWTLYKVYRRRSKLESAPLQYCEYCNEFHGGLTLHRNQSTKHHNQGYSSVVKG